MTDYLSELFTNDEAVIAANIVEFARIASAEAADRLAEQARLVKRVADRCPKCAGEGRLPQFSHRNGGTCFTCGGSGVFARYA